MKIICVAVILLLLSGIGVMAVNNDLKDVKSFFKMDMKCQL